ncbi:hypothetical protein [Erythrobacter sp. HL-111]|uniref:hypothetical protein n=1 Tax=Erythrobacter sp. HL-111 TaxID=1798193 RepID=UPI0006DAEB42|nr:hypothetical protein [Erythrobacter sp. HL-111]KPP82468.1 MAG: putative protein conserved in bacteria (DUF2171) [Erythrobacteraceae bacterium HL-111]SDS84503.1 hypothetical protein SAMN04515621_2350 [Erythrobacter sp. HL-111]
MNKLLAASAAMAFALTAPAVAQEGMPPASSEASTIQPGTAIYGSDGAEVGTVAGAQGDVVLLKVGEEMIPIPSAAISQGAEGPQIDLTRDALMAQFEQQKAVYEAEFDAAVKEGAPVQTVDNRSLGTIQTVSGNDVTVEGDNGPMTLPKASLALNQQGEVTVRATMAQIREAMSASPESR